MSKRSRMRRGTQGSWLKFILIGPSWVPTTRCIHATLGQFCRHRRPPKGRRSQQGRAWPFFPKQVSCRAKLLPLSLSQPFHTHRERINVAHTLVNGPSYSIIRIPNIFDRWTWIRTQKQKCFVLFFSSLVLIAPGALPKHGAVLIFN